eukprot:6889278-Pyramimonas_sp.AAC.1
MGSRKQRTDLSGVGTVLSPCRVRDLGCPPGPDCPAPEAHATIVDSEDRRPYPTLRTQPDRSGLIRPDPIL